jgi:UPF0042 nucleotide-binding protein
LREWANRLLDTTNISAHDLAGQVRQSFAAGEDEPVLSVMSFGFARGLPRNADLVFDMRFLQNPHWVPALRPGTGLDDDVAAYVAADPTYEEAFGRIADLVALLLPRYRAEGNPMSRWRSAVPGEDTGRSMSPPGWGGGCTSVAFRPR